MQAPQPPRSRPNQLRSSRPWPRHSELLLALLLGLALRVLLWNNIPRTGLISDEGEYLSAADWLAHGRGFAWYLGYLWTRAPIYPLFVAAHLRLFGETTAPIYISQIILSLANIAQVYFLARQLAPAGQAGSPQAATLRYVPAVAALLMAVYFPFALYTQAVLSETLFLALLLGAFLALGSWVTKTGRQADRRVTLKTQNSKLPSFLSNHLLLIVAGVLFGLATLTRSLTLLFLPIVALWLLVRSQEPGAGAFILRPASGIRRPSSLVAFSLAAALTILPWTVYNSRVYQGLVVVDTSGAFNILLGGRTAYDGDRSDAATRDFALALLDRQLTTPERERMLADQYGADRRLRRIGSCLYNQNDPALLAAIARPAGEIGQAERQQLMTREGLCLIRAKPFAFVQKALAELVDLFQINPTGAERFANKFSSGRIPPPYAVALFVLDDTVYVLALPLAIVGWAIARRSQMIACRSQINQAAEHSQSTILRRRSGQVHNLQSLIGLWWLYNLAVAPLLFAINRFRLPLLPFAFIFAAYALLALANGGWHWLRSRYGAICVTLAALLFLIAATPYAYLEPRPIGAPATWASYLGPYPSSLAITRQIIAARPGYLRAEQFRAALQAGRLEPARATLQSGDLTTVRADGIAADMRTLATALLAGQAGQPDQGIYSLPTVASIAAAKDIEAAVVLGDLLRRKGDPASMASARAILGQTFVDNNNPVEWAWDWLRPAPLPDRRIDLAGNFDLGYISGCYLGEGDTSIQPPANFRWCTDGARLRFPAAGTGAPQALSLRADGRGWTSYASTPPPVQVFAGARPAGAFTPDIRQPATFTVTLPATPPGADVIVTLRTGTFVADASRYLSQQGKAVVGQVQRLGVRLDWAELSEAAQ